MPGPGPKTTTGAAVSTPLLPDELTQAGRIVAEHASLWKGRIRAADLATVAKPSRSRVRQASEQSNAGRRFLRDGKPMLAIEWLRRSTELDPTVASVEHDLGLACLAAGRLQEAVNALRRAVSLDPDLGL